MKKGLKIFFKIVYYIFTFGLGLLLAIAMPRMYLYELVGSDTDKCLKNGDYHAAMMYTGGYFDDRPAYQQDFEDNSGIVIYEAATLYIDENNVSRIRKTLSGFYYNVTYYTTVGKDNNQTCLRITDDRNNTYNITLLDNDSDSDGEYEKISTMISTNYIYFDIPEELTTSVTKLEFIDKNGSAHQTINVDLNFNGKFFQDVNEFIESYNINNKDEKTLSKIDERFRSIDENYILSGDYEKLSKKANTKALCLIVVYFVCIYVLGDFIVGRHYIYHFFKKIYLKILRKVNPDKLKTESVYGTDYYSQVKITAKFDDGQGQPVTVTLENEKDKIVFVLTSANDYTVEQRVHAGKYDLNIEVNGNYELFNIDKSMIVEGYTSAKEIMLKKRAN